MRWLVVCLLIFWGFGTSSVSAQVVINEFSAKSPEWVELYNSSDQEINLSGWLIKDTANHTKELTVSLPAGGFTTVDTNWLNDTGDTIFLVESATSSTILDSIVYGAGEPVTIPDSGKSAGRVPDGSSTWFSDLEITKGTKNPDALPSPTLPPTPTATRTPTPTHTPTPSRVPTASRVPAGTTSSVPVSKTPTPTSSPKPTAQPSAETASPYLTSTIHDLRSATTGEVLAVSDVQNPKSSALPWGAIILIGLGVSLIGVALFFLLKKPPPD